MGEAKRRRTQQDIGADLTKELTEKGKLIEAGFAALASMVLPKNAPAIQLYEMQLAFMAGAEHVWSSMMTMLDPGEEPTEADLRRMDLIQKELVEWREKLLERVSQPLPPASEDRFRQLRLEQRLGDAPVQQEYQDKMAAVMRAIDEFVNGGAKGDARKTGVVLLMAPFGETSGRCNFMSNGIDRHDIVNLFKEMIARFEGQPEITGRA